MGISRQAIYQQVKRQQERRRILEPVKQMVLELRRSMLRLGTRKLHHLLKKRWSTLGIKLGRDGLFKYLREHCLLVPAKRRYIKTTDSRHWMRKFPNVLKDMTVTRPEQVFVSDITYVESDEGVHYLSLVTDAYSRKIMGYEVSREMKAYDTLKALKRAVSNRLTDAPILHHSDRGSQYCSAAYQKVLHQHGLSASMTDGYDCYQNARAERVNSILKQEFLLYRCRTFNELKMLVRQAVTIYNRMRPHLSLGLNTPEEVHKKASYET